MTPEDALKNVDAAIAQVSANRQVHNVLLESIKVLREAINLHEKAGDKG